MAKKKSKGKENVTFSLSMPSEMREWLAAESDEQELPVSKIVYFILKKYREKQKTKNN